MSKAERNEKIIEGLQKCGTQAGAARHAFVDRGTVRRLLDHDKAAEAALWRGTERRLMRSVDEHAFRVREAFAAFRGSRDALCVEQKRLVKDYPGMTAEHIRSAEQDLEQLHSSMRVDLQALRRRDRAHERSIRRYAGHCMGQRVDS